MVNTIWLLILIIATSYAILTGSISEVNDAIFSAPKSSVYLVLELTGMLMFWTGMLNVAKKSGMIDFIAGKFSKITHYLFPEIPKQHHVHGLIATNLVANLLGLGSVATPIGIKTIKEMRKLNDDKDVASNSMITLIIINTSSLTVIPTTIVTLRYVHGSANPTLVIPIIIIASSMTTIIAILLDRIIRRKKNKKLI